MLTINEKPKRILPSWIWEQLKELDFTSIYDPFTGIAPFGIFLKHKGKQILASDMLQCYYWWNKAFIENNNIKLSPELQKTINNQEKDSNITNIFGAWKDQYFTEDEVNWLSSWFYNINSLNLKDEERSLAYAAVYLVISYWLSYNRKHLSYPKPMSPYEILNYYFSFVNNLVFDNKLTNTVYFSDAYSMVSQLPTDLIFIYPPTPEGFRNYDLRYYLWECWTRQATQLNMEELITYDNRPKLGQTFNSLEDYLQALNYFLELAQGNHIWVIAYNDQSLLDRDSLLNIVQRHRKVWHEAETFIPYPTAVGTSVVKEGLIIGIAE